MSAGMAIVVVLILFLTLVVLELPVGVAVGASAVVGIVGMQGVEITTNVLSRSVFTATAKYSLFVIPMFVLLGSVIAHSGIAEQLYRAVNRFVYRLPGGLAATAVVATSAFSGISGSSSADVATFGRISVSQMSRYGYDKAYAAAVVAAAGTFAILIPPSIVLVLYGIIAGENVGALLLAGIIPGTLSALILVAFVVIRGMSGSGSGGDSPSIASVKPPPLDKNNVMAIVYGTALFGIILGGIYSGIFTATEAGAVGAFAAILIAVAASKAAGKSIPRVFATATRDTADVTGMIFLLLIGGALMAYFITLTRIPIDLANWATNLNIPGWVLVAMILVFVIPMGMFLDGLSIMLLVVPVVAPVVDALGFEGVWFGILLLKVIEIGLLTPPVGLNVFIISGISKVPVERVFRKVLPFVLLDIAITALFFAVPDIVMILPRLSGV